MKEEEKEVKKSPVLIEKVDFHKSPQKYEALGDRGIEHAVNSGIMTDEDAQRINSFVKQLRARNDIGHKRVYKIRNGLTNTGRFFKTPFSENTIDDLYDGFENLKMGTGTKRLPNGELVDTGKPLSQLTIRDYMSYVKRFYLWMIDRGYSTISKEDIEEIKIIRPKTSTKTADDLLTKQQIHDMINVCTCSRDRAIISTLYEGAFRIGEIGQMVWEDLDFSDKHFLTIRTIFKTDNERRIPLHTARPYVIQWMNDYPGLSNGQNPVFISQYNTSLTYVSIKKQLNIIAKRAGIEKAITPHIFRHSRITHMIRDGWTDSAVKSIAWGTLKTDMFDTYVHLTSEDVKNEARRHFGIEIPKESIQSKVLDSRQCPRCLEMNSPTDNFCSVCGNPLTGDVEVSFSGVQYEIHNDPLYAQLKANSDMIPVLRSLLENLESSQTKSH